MIRHCIFILFLGSTQVFCANTEPLSAPSPEAADLIEKIEDGRISRDDFLRIVAMGLEHFDSLTKAEVLNLLTPTSRKRVRDPSSDKAKPNPKRKKTKNYILAKNPNNENSCYLSPHSKKPDSIYYFALAEVKEDQETRITPKKRISVGENISHLIEQGISEQEALFKTLLDVEIQLLEKITDHNGRIIDRTLYVGKSKDVQERMYGHKKDFQDEVKRLSHKKCDLVHRYLEYGDVRVSTIAEDVPQEFQDAFECLIGHILSPEGSKVLGNGRSWKLLGQYLDWHERSQLLQSLELEGVQERHKIKQLCKVLDFTELE